MPADPTSAPAAPASNLVPLSQALYPPGYDPSQITDVSPADAANAPKQAPTPAGNLVPLSEALRPPGYTDAQYAASMPPTEAPQHGFWDNVGAGLEKAGHDITDYPAEMLARGAQSVGLTRLLQAAGINAPTADQTAAMDKAAAQNYDTNYSGSVPATGARILGDIVGTLPIIASGEGLVNAGANVAESALPEVAGKAIAGGARFLTGAGGTGRVGQYASKVANAVGQGAAATALTSGREGPNAGEVGTGAIVGGIAGAAAPIVSGIAGMAGKQIGRMTGLLPETTMATLRGATAKLTQALQRDGMTPEEAIAKLRDMGPNATLADVGGKNTLTTLESLANEPGATADLAQDFLGNRAGERLGRVNEAIKGATGAQTGFHDAATQLMKERASAAAPKYEAAFSRIVPTADEAAQVQRFINDPIGQDALQKGLRIVQLENLAAGKPFNPADYGVTRADNGNFALEGDKVPNLRLMDAVKRGYDDIVEGFRDPTTGKLNLNQYGRAVNSVRAAYVGALKDMYPRYASALAAWSGPSASLDALNMGRRALNNDPEITSKIVSGLSDGDKQFFRLGVARALMDKVAGKPDAADLSRALFGNSAIRNKIASAFDNEQAFQNFAKEMAKESRFSRVENAALNGSQTARRLAGQTDLGVNPLPHIMQAAHGDLAGAAIGLGSRLAGAVGPSQAVKDTLGQMLLSGNADELTQAFERVRPGFTRRALSMASRMAGKGVVPGAATAVERGVLAPSEPNVP